MSLGFYKNQLGATLLEMILVLSLLAVGTLMALWDKQVEMEQQKAKIVGFKINQYNGAVRSYIAKNPDLIAAVKSGTTWLKNTSCGGPLTVGSEYLPCDFPTATVAAPIPFGMLSFNTSIDVTGTGSSKRITATTTTGQFSVPRGNVIEVRSDLAGIAALTAASATQTGFTNNGSGGLTPAGAGTDSSYKSNPLDGRITMITSNKADNDVWLRTDGGNKMHAPLRFDATDPLNRQIEGASRIQNLASDVLFLGTASGVAPATASRVVVDTNTEIIGTLRVRNSLTVDNGATVTGNVQATGNVNAGASVTAAGNVNANGSVWAAGNVSANASVTAAGNVTAGGAMVSQLYYDANNTGYYVDPASTSQLNAINSNSINNAGPIVSNGRIYSNEYIQLSGYAAEGNWCASNGLIGRDGAGKTLSCQNNVWQSNSGGAPSCVSITIPGYAANDVTTYACPASYTKVGWDTTGENWRNSSTPGLIIGKNDWAVIFCCKF